MQENVDPVCRLTCRLPRYLVCQYYGLHELPLTPFQLHRLPEKSDFALYQSKTFHSFTSSIQRSRKKDIILQPEQQTSLILTLNKPAPALHTGMLLFCFFCNRRGIGSTHRCSPSSAPRSIAVMLETLTGVTQLLLPLLLSPFLKSDEPVKTRRSTWGS